MAATQNTPSDHERAEGALDERFPRPDEDSPHDVPDESVIEKTLPSSPLPGSRQRPQ